MKISTRGRYGIRMLLDIAAHQENGYVAMKDIAKRQQFSKKYADQIALQLCQAGILQASRGRTGGYKLIARAKDITVLEVLQVLEGSLAPVQCLETDENVCERCEFCMTLPLWKDFYTRMTEYLKSVTIQSLIDKAPAQPVFDGD